MIIIKEVIIIIKLTLKDPDALKVLIALKGLNEKQFSEKIGISNNYLNQIVSGKRQPAPPTARRIAKGVDKSIPDIFLFKQLAKSKQKESN